MKKRRESYTPAWAVTLVPLAALLGLGLVQWLPSLPAPGWGRPALGLLFASALLAWRRPRPWTFALLALLAGAAWATWRAQDRLAERLPAALEGQVLTLTGRVDSLPQRLAGFGGAEGWRFEFEVAPRDPTAPPVHGLPPRLLLSCYQMVAEPRVGERWRFDIKLRRPHGLLNPHGPDAALWMLEQDLGGAGSCRARGQRRLSDGAPWRIDAWRQWLREAIGRQVSDGRRAGVLAALSLGDQNAVPQV